MKILMVNSVCGIRSTGRICADLATVLESRGNEVRIAYGREGVPKQFEHFAVKIGKDLDVKIHGLRVRLFDDCGFGSKKATKRFIRWVEDFDPDVIHLHNLHGYYINIKELFDYLKICNKKVLWTFHDGWAFTGHSAYCDVIRCEKWRTGCYDCAMKKKYPASFIDRSKRNWEKKKKLFNGVSDMIIITPSEWLKTRVKRSFLSKYPVKVVHNGIDTVQFCPGNKDLKKYYSNGKYMLLGVAISWDEMKGYGDYIQLANALGEEYKVVLVGLTKEQIAKLPENMKGIERTNSVQELVNIYSSADLFLNLSYCENYPTVDLEAIACGTPVISYDVGGGTEIIKAYGGVVVPRGDVLSVAEIIRQCKKGERKIEVAYNNIEIDKATCVDAYVDLYASL